MIAFLRSTMRHFGGSIIVMAIAFAALYAFTGSAQALLAAATLTVVEIAVSFDNAIVNAAHLQHVTKLWRRVFLTVGMLVAVGFMRLYFPIQIVSIIGGVPIGHAIDLAMHDHAQFANILISSHHIVAGFGGGFLMMVALGYFIDGGKEDHWLPGVERLLQMGGEYILAFDVIVTSAASYFVSTLMGKEHGDPFFNAAFVGIMVYISVDFLKKVLEQFDAALANGAFKFLAGGLGTFIYLEVLDASFSFDGVIAAFAISNDVIVVMCGLGIGALFVRSMTVMMVDQGTLNEYRYLEHGAFWAIGALSVFMFAGAVVHVPEWMVAGSSIVIILGALAHSIIDNRRHAYTATDVAVSEIDLSRAAIGATPGGIQMMRSADDFHKAFGEPQRRTSDQNDIGQPTEVLSDVHSIMVSHGGSEVAPDIASARDAADAAPPGYATVSVSGWPAMLVKKDDAMGVMERLGNMLTAGPRRSARMDDGAVARAVEAGKPGITASVTPLVNACAEVDIPAYTDPNTLCGRCSHLVAETITEVKNRVPAVQSLATPAETAEALGHPSLLTRVTAAVRAFADPHEQPAPSDHQVISTASEESEVDPEVLAQLTADSGVQVVRRGVGIATIRVIPD
jgi:hypothetical protein